MSNYAVSVLAKGQSVVTQKYQAPEQRRKLPSVFELAIQNSQVSIPNANELRKSALRPVEIYYFKKVSQGAGTAKAYNHTGTYSDSASMTVSYVTHVEKFSLPRKIAQNNIFTYQQMFNNLYEESWRNLRNRHDTSALSFVYANRVQLSAATMNPQLASANPGTWNDTNYALEISLANQKLFIQKAKSALAARYLLGDYDVIADLQIANQMEFDMNQGSANSVNTAFQNRGLNVATTQDVIDANYSLGSTLWMPKGMLSGLFWNDPLNKTGVTEDRGGSVGTLGTVADPFGSGAVGDISVYTGRADTSANSYGGDTQDIVDQYEVTLTVGYVAPPLNTASDSVIMEIAQTS